MGSRGFSPAALFANGEEGGWYDPSKLSSMKQLSDGTVDAVVDSPVGYIEDQSGNGNTLIQATTATRPTLRQSGSLYYLEFSGSQGMVSSSDIDFTGTDAMTICVGVTKDSDQTSNIAELSVNSGGTNPGSFRFGSISGNIWRYSSRGTEALVAASATGFSAGTNVLTGLSDISDDSVIIRVDGSQEGSSATDQGTGNYGDYPLNLGARNNGNALQLDGRIYSFIVRGASSSAAEIASIETYVANKTGVSL